MPGRGDKFDSFDDAMVFDNGETVGVICLGGLDEFRSIAIASPRSKRTESFRRWQWQPYGRIYG
jgi:hypothetical protein